MGDGVGLNCLVTEIHLCLTSHPGQLKLLNLAIPPWVGGLNTGDGLLASTREKNGEFCVTVGPVTRTAGILA